MTEKGDLDAKMMHRIGPTIRMGKLERVSGILCDQIISLKVKGEVYKTVVRPAMYGAETWAAKKAQ